MNNISKNIPEFNKYTKIEDIHIFVDAVRDALKDRLKYIKSVRSKGFNIIDKERYIATQRLNSIPWYQFHARRILKYYIIIINNCIFILPDGMNVKYHLEEVFEHVIEADGWTYIKTIKYEEYSSLIENSLASIVEEHETIDNIKNILEKFRNDVDYKKVIDWKLEI